MTGKGFTDASQAALVPNASGVYDTLYGSYDERGNATSITDPSGVTSTLTYSGDRLASSTVSGLTTQYASEQEKLIRTQYPEGNYEVYCHRTGTSGGACTGGTFTDKLQWKAKSAVSDGSVYSEKVIYSYWPDGTVQQESYLDSTGAMRRIAKFAKDAHKRDTWQGRGDISGIAAIASVKSYDPANNLTGVGPSANAAPAFCGGVTGVDGTPASKLCTWLKYDRADRLSEMTEFPTTTSSGAKTCFAYDAQGNVSSVRAGCGTSCTSCTAPTSSYAYDDFGNVISATLPWTDGGGGTAGTTRYEYDAQHNLLTKQSPAQVASSQWLSYTYDTLSRQQSASLVGTSTSTLLYAFGFDNVGGAQSAGSGCPSLDNTQGRQLYRDDSFGRTSFSYDALGRVTKEVLRSGVTSCSSTTPNDNPHTFYAYSNNGNLTSIQYPFGRTVTYGYGVGANSDRISSVSVTMHDGTAWSAAPGMQIISNVQWEPYGGLRGYQLYHYGAASGSEYSSVEYLEGDDGSVAPTPGSECALTGSTVGSSDQTGRLRGLLVSTGSFTLGSGNGDLFKRTYTWKGDLVARTDTCLKNATTGHTETFTYDNQQRLTAASRPTNEFANRGGSFSSRSYGYNSRGNRTSQVNEDCTYNLTYGTASAPDRLTRYATGTNANGKNCSSNQLHYDYSYDVDGRVTSKSSIDAAQASLTLSPTGVYATASVQGGVYTYFYDALNRRRLKQFPLAGVDEEYFYDLDHSLLVTRSIDSVISSTPGYSTDEYVWLGGRPVAMVRGAMSSTWSRTSDTTTAACPRYGPSDSTGTNDACGIYFPVTDHIGKPVLMLDYNRKIAGVGEYDPFGSVNSVSINKESAHPYPVVNGNSEFANFGQMPGTGMSVDLHVLFWKTDVTTNSVLGIADKVKIIHATTGAVFESIGTNGVFSHRWSQWHPVSAGKVKTVLNGSGVGQCLKSTGLDPAVLTNYCATTDSTCPCYGNPSSASLKWGAAIAGYQYRRYETGAKKVWTPLRFPGQYWDEETGLFENWNRFYDPSIGRYLQPEPYLQDPRYSAGAAMTGRSVPAYAYAGNNPLHNVDRDGNDFVIDDILALPATGAAAAAAGAALCVAAADAYNKTKDKIRDWAMDHSKPDPECKPCDRPLPPPRVDEDHSHGACPGSHVHYWVWEQNPKTCECFMKDRYNCL